RLLPGNGARAPGRPGIYGVFVLRGARAEDVGAGLGGEAADDGLERAGLGVDAALPLVRDAVAHHRPDGFEVGAAAERNGERGDVLQERLDLLAQRGLTAPVVEDDLGVEAVAGGAPLVLADDPRAEEVHVVPLVVVRAE